MILKFECKGTTFILFFQKNVQINEKSCIFATEKKY
jgi:hypothetical protein